MKTSSDVDHSQYIITYPCQQNAVGQKLSSKLLQGKRVNISTHQVMQLIRQQMPTLAA